MQHLSGDMEQRHKGYRLVAAVTMYVWWHIGEILYLIERIRHRSWAKTRKVIACGCCSYKPVTLSRKSLARQGDSWGPFCLGPTHSVVWCPSSIPLPRYYQQFVPHSGTLPICINTPPGPKFLLTPWVPPSWRDRPNSHLRVSELNFWCLLISWDTCLSFV